MNVNCKFGGSNEKFSWFMELDAKRHVIEFATPREFMVELSQVILGQLYTERVKHFLKLGRMTKD